MMFFRRAESTLDGDIEGKTEFAVCGMVCTPVIR